MNWAPPTFAAVLVGLGAVVALTDPGPPSNLAEEDGSLPVVASAAPVRPLSPSRLLLGLDGLPTAVAAIQAADLLGPTFALPSLVLAVPAAAPPSASLVRQLAGRAEREARASIEAALARVAPYAVSEAFAAGRGALPAPVRGRPIDGFGPRRRSNTETVVRHPGLTFEVQAGAEVQAVARGIVVHAGRLRGYGAVVVVAHDSGYHTVYAQLDELSVAPGAVVEAGAVLGRTGSASPGGGRRLYFELRRHGDALDPSEWIAASP